MKKLISILITAILILTTFAGCAGSKDSENILKVAMDLKYPPFTGTDANGKPEGLEIDIAMALGKYLGMEVKIINTDFSIISAYSETAMAVKKGNTGLLEKVNAFIASMYEDDGFYEQAGTKYDVAIGKYLQDGNLGLEYIIHPPRG